MSDEGKDPPVRPADSFLGYRLNNLHVVERLGKGGFGAVYRAEHERLKTSFAIKILNVGLQDNEQVLARFEREAQASATLQHPHIIRVSDFGQLEDGRSYLVMDYLEGQSLDEAIKADERFEGPRIQRLMDQLCGALGYIHHRGFVHRDLKPSNVFLRAGAQGYSEESVQLIDFGIAALMDDHSLTQSGMTIGTPTYMSPEQAMGKAATVDGRADLYALGIILFELLAGRPPFVGESFASLIFQHLSEPPPHLEQVCPRRAWSPRLDAFLQEALAKKPEERIPDAKTFLSRLEEAFSAQETYAQAHKPLLPTVEKEAPVNPANPDSLGQSVQGELAYAETGFQPSMEIVNDGEKGTLRKPVSPGGSDAVAGNDATAATNVPRSISQHTTLQAPVAGSRRGALWGGVGALLLVCAAVAGWWWTRAPGKTEPPTDPPTKKVEARRPPPLPRLTPSARKALAAKRATLQKNITQLQKASAAEKVKELPGLYFALMRAEAMLDRKAQARAAFVRALKEGFWDLQKAQDDPAMAALRQDASIVSLLEGLRKDTHELRWLRHERQVLFYELQPMLAEESWRQDRKATKLYHNPLPTREYATPAVALWRDLLKRAQETQKQAVARWLQKRLSLLGPPNQGPLQRRLAVRSRGLAHARFLVRKQAAQWRAFVPELTPAQKAARASLLPLVGRWRWQTRDLGQKDVPAGEITWSAGATHLFGESSYIHKGKKVTLALNVTFAAGELRLIFFELSGVFIFPGRWDAASGSFIWQKKKARPGSLQRILWKLEGQKLEEIRQTRKETGGWSLLYAADWRKESAGAKDSSP